ncbi:MAG: SDR family NAD(P)-dependent oxidoreductase [Christensenellales bacterium]
MEKKNIILVGVCGGMGGATAELLIRNGYNVIGIDYSPSCSIDKVRYFQADITQTKQIENIFTEISKAVNNIYAIIHLAGIYLMDSLVEMSEERFKKIFDINVFGIYRINKIFLPLLSRGSRILITSSEVAPLDPLPFNGIYSITKSTIEKYAYSLRMELNLLGIDVSILRPGAVKTKLLNASTNELDNFCKNTQIYEKTSKEFKKIVESIEAKNVSSEKVAIKINKFLSARKPKYVYKINRNKLLLIFNALPDRLQVWLIKKLLLKNNKKAKS